MILTKNNHGFIALFTVIIVSFVLLIMTITSTFSGFSGRFNIFDSESKERSAELADACIEEARLAIATDHYTLGDEVEKEVDDETCTYEVSGSGNEIKAWAEINRAKTFYWVGVNKDESHIPVTGFKECETLSPCP